MLRQHHEHHFARSGLITEELNDNLVRVAVVALAKLLHNARMAGLSKLRCSVARGRKGPDWAVLYVF